MLLNNKRHILNRGNKISEDMFGFRHGLIKALSTIALHDSLLCFSLHFSCALRLVSSCGAETAASSNSRQALQLKFQERERHPELQNQFSVQQNDKQQTTGLGLDPSSHHRINCSGQKVGSIHPTCVATAKRERSKNYIGGQNDIAYRYIVKLNTNVFNIIL